MSQAIVVNHAQLSTIVSNCMDKHLPLFIHGTMGIGKSYAVREAAKKQAEKLNKTFVDWNHTDNERKLEIFNDYQKELPKLFLYCDERISQLDAADLRGLPNFVHDGQVVNWTPSMVFFLLSRKGASGLLFLDELNLAQPNIQSAAYQLINDKTIGELKLSDELSVIGAGNRAEDHANTFDMAKPLANRFLHVELRAPNCEEWVRDFAYMNGIDARVVGFLQFAPHRLMIEEKALAKQNLHAFASPRSWERGSTAIKGVDDNTMAAIILSTAVGEAVGREFGAFLEVCCKLDVDEILNNPSKTLPKYKNDMQTLWAIVSSAIGKYNENEKLQTKILDLAAAMDDLHLTDFCVAILQMWKYGKHNHKVTEEPGELLKRYNKSGTKLSTDQLVKFSKYLA